MKTFPTYILFDERVSTVPKYNRKYWSYFGALNRQNTSDPRGSWAIEIAGWADNNRKELATETYFDPGNWHYSICTRLLLPGLGSQGNWNNETMGDLVESLLGMQYPIACFGTFDCACVRDYACIRATSASCG